MPPAARRGGYAAAAGRPSAPPPAQATKPNGQVPLNGNKAPLVPLNKGPASGTQGKPQPPAASKGGKPVQAQVPASDEASKKPASPAPASSTAPAVADDNGAAPTEAAEAAETRPEAVVVPAAPLACPNYRDRRHSMFNNDHIGCIAKLTSRTQASSILLLARIVNLLTRSARRWWQRSSLLQRVSGRSSWRI